MLPEAESIQRWSARTGAWSFLWASLLVTGGIGIIIAANSMVPDCYNRPPICEVNDGRLQASGAIMTAGLVVFLAAAPMVGLWFAGYREHGARERLRLEGNVLAGLPTTERKKRQVRIDAVEQLLGAELSAARTASLWYTTTGVLWAAAAGGLAILFFILWTEQENFALWAFIRTLFFGGLAALMLTRGVQLGAGVKGVSRLS